MPKKKTTKKKVASKKVAKPSKAAKEAELAVKETIDGYILTGLTLKRKKFVENLFASDFNVTRSYKEAFSEDGKMTDNVAAVAGSRLLRNVKVQEVINARLSAQRVDEDWIKSTLITTIHTCQGNPKWAQTIVSACETLAKMGGYLQPETQVNNFFKDNVLFFEPIATKERSEELKAIIADSKSRVIE